MVLDSDSGQHSIVELKIIATRVYGGNKFEGAEADDVLFTKGSLVFPCGGGTALEVRSFEKIIYVNKINILVFSSSTVVK